MQCECIDVREHESLHIHTILRISFPAFSYNLMINNQMFHTDLSMKHFVDYYHIIYKGISLLDLMNIEMKPSKIFLPILCIYNNETTWNICCWKDNYRIVLVITIKIATVCSSLKKLKNYMLNIM